jgi:mannosyl-3-phosphoglycerate phosphatase family protein
MSTDYLLVPDLDGSLLDHHSYSYQAALPALAKCKAEGIPVIFNTSKTHSECLQLRANLDIKAPYIIENGSAIIIPKGLFKDEFLIHQGLSEYEQQYSICLGSPRPSLLAKLIAIRINNQFDFLGFNDFSIEQICQHTGLSKEQAKQAAERHFSEPILWLDSKEKFKNFKQLLSEQGLSLVTGGRFHHVIGPSDKARALLWLKQLYQQAANSTASKQQGKNKVQVIALGDGENDIAMLEAADFAVAIKSPVNQQIKVNHKHVVHTLQTGPSGWNQAVLELLADSTRETEHT